MSLDYLGYVGGMYGTMDGAFGFLGAYFSSTLFFSTFCASLFLYKKKSESENELEVNKNESEI